MTDQEKETARKVIARLFERPVQDMGGGLRIVSLRVTWIPVEERDLIVKAVSDFIAASDCCKGLAPRQLCRCYQDEANAATLTTDRDVDAVAWDILQALHANVPEADRPQSWSDMNQDQEARIRAAAVAAIERIAERACAALPSKVEREEIEHMREDYEAGHKIFASSAAVALRVIDRLIAAKSNPPAGG